MRQPLLTLLWLLTTAALAPAAEPLDGRTAADWQPQAGWTPQHRAASFTAANENGRLALSLTGRGQEMTWTYMLAPAEVAGEPRYLVADYQTAGLDASSGSYFLMVQDGSPNWRRLVSRKDLVCDGRPHQLVVDLHSFRPPAPPNALVVQIGPATADSAKLLLRLEFTDHPPADVKPVECAWPAAQKRRIQFATLSWTPAPKWVPNPAAHAALQKSPAGMNFSMQGAGRSMRWTAKLPAPLDLGRLPYVSLRYRATGEFGPSGYVFYLAAKEKGKTQSVHAMQPGDVQADGRWHVFGGQIDSHGTATGGVAAGIDALSSDAHLELDYIEFSSQPARAAIADAVEFTRRDGPWPAGRDGLTTIELPPPERSQPLLLPRLAVGSWFDTREISVEGVPFRVPPQPQLMPATGMVDEEDLSLPLPAGSREVLLLLAAAFPPAERFGGDGLRDTPLRQLDEPERMTVELSYADGSREELIPLAAATATHAVGHGLGVYSLSATPGKTPVRMTLHDRMRSAAFGLAGLTVNRGQPRFPEPESPQLWYPPVKKPPLAPAQILLDASHGLTWDRISSAMLGPAPVNLAGQPVFRLTLDGRSLTSADFQAEHVDRTPQYTRITAAYARGDVSLRATVQAVADGANGVRLALELTNLATKPITGTLAFPTVEHLALGSPTDTWFFCGRRGGVISRESRQLRDEIGESHPLQVDGFFNPALGAGVAFMPRDVEGIFRWYAVGKDATGGNYALEFLPETVGQGKAWHTVPVLVSVVPGDWRDQWRSYLAWVKTWYQPTAPRKPWFREVFSFPTYSPATPFADPPQQRTDFLALARRREALIPGSTDYVHLFGWAITEKYGHWGAYDHFENLGGKPAFHAAVERCQQAGIPVGMYLDGYLVDDHSDKPAKSDVEHWAIIGPDGKPLHHAGYGATSMCPYTAGWRQYLTDAYRRLAADIQPSGLYIDELGKCMTSRTCYAKDHGHRWPMGMCSGEWILSQEIRQAVPPGIATYCEYAPADVATQFLDGAFQHVALYNYRDGLRRVAPYFVDLQRFSFPDFKTFELIYYVPLRNGNWFLLKYPFFNGDGYYLTDARLDGYDQHARAFLTTALKIQHAHRAAFTSGNVEPLVPTQCRGVYANRFTAKGETVWTLYNANDRTAAGPLLSVPHRRGQRYADLWNDRPLEPTLQGDQALLRLDLGPHAVGCVVQRR